MKHTLVLIGLLSASIVFSETLSLRSAQEKLLQMNPDIRIQKAEQQKVEAQLSEARSAFWPSLDLSGSYQAFTEKQEINLALPAPLPAVNRTLGDHDREEYGIDLSYSLFSGGRDRQQILARRSSVDAQGQKLRVLENQLSLRLISLYCAWHMAKASVTAQDSIRQYHENYLNQVAALVKGGATLPSKELMAKSRLLNSQVELQAAVDLLDSVERATGSLLGTFSVSFTLDTTQSGPSESRPEHRSELAYLEKTSESLTHQEKAIFAQKLPTVVGLLGYRLANPGLNLGANDYMNYGLVSVQLRWNLFDGFRNQAQRSQTRLQREEIQIEQQRQKDGFWEAENSLSKSLARMDRTRSAAQMSLDAARMALSETRAQRDHGTASDLDLLDAKILEAKSALQLNHLFFRMYFTSWQLRYVTGEDLKFTGDKYEIENPSPVFRLPDGK